METQQLEFAMAAIRAGNFTQAAKRCFTSRQNIAHAVKSIEGIFHLTLFRREGRQLVLTEDGTLFAAKAQQLIALLDEMHRISSDAQEIARPLRIKVSAQLFSGIDEGFARSVLDLGDAMQLSEGDCVSCVEAVRDGTVDGALVCSMKDSYPECDALHLFTVPAYAWMRESSSLAGCDEVALSDLAQKSLLFLSDDPSQYEGLLNAFHGAGLYRMDLRTVLSTNLAVELIRRSDCIGVVSKHFARHAPEGTVAVPLAGNSADWRFFFLYSNSSKASRRALSLVKEAKRKASGG